MSRDSTVYGYRGRPWALLSLFLVIAGTYFILTQRPVDGAWLALAAVLPLTARTWTIDSQAHELSIRYDLFGLSLSRRSWPLSRVERIAIEPAGPGFFRFGSRYGMMISLIVDGRRVTVVSSQDEREIARELRELRGLLPRGLKVHRRNVYKAWKP